MDMKKDQDAYDLVREYVRLQEERRRVQCEVDERNARLLDLSNDLGRITRAVGPLLGGLAYEVKHGHKTFSVRRSSNVNRLDCVELMPMANLIGAKAKPTAQPIAADAVADSPNDDLDNDAALVSFAQWRGQ